MRCTMLLTVTTREPGTGSICSSSSPVRAKCPRWLVPNCSSNPSRVVCLGVSITPALLTSKSILGCLARSSPAAARIESSEVRSRGWTMTFAPGAVPAMRAAARLPFSTSRTASTTDAPRAARTWAVSNPRPVFAPVTTASRPCWPGTSSLVHFAFMIPPDPLLAMPQRMPGLYRSWITVQTVIHYWIIVQTVIPTLIEIQGYNWPHEEATAQAGPATGQCERGGAAPRPGTTAGGHRHTDRLSPRNALLPLLRPRRPGRVPAGRAPARRRRDNRARRHNHPATRRPAALSDNRARRVPRGAARSMRRPALLRGSHRTTRNPHGREDATLATPLRKLLDEGAATGQFTISDSRDAANAILGAALIATLTRWEDGRDTQDPEFQQALTDQLVQSVTRA